MENLSHASRLVTAGAACSAICAGAGIVAFTGEGGVKISAGLLVVAVVVALIGYAYADNRRLGWGAAVLVAATLPLFGVLYAIGASVMLHLGATVAGGSLIALSIAVAGSTIALLNRIVRNSGAVRRGAPRAPSER
ncbi:MAG: hypothetical protein ABUL62_11790 [Myxococcales bacterium]